MGSKKWYEKNPGNSLPITYKESGHPIGGFIQRQWGQGNGVRLSLSDIILNFF